ncbi:GNAT family N-acetyltransferase [Alteromonas flava]|uniref:GNAT family N-acetyltransferase n=1 Tax=Alteromonas flava TaxID=2048003 RepID=UPI000C2859FA|nr:GNAT family N-acetyltransferase [Alteromonas flava]
MLGYRISTTQSEFDNELIYRFISTSYWAAGMPRELLEKAIANSWCFAVFDQDNRQVAFARLITDKATFGYLADVFVIEDARGQGISKYLVEHIVSLPEVKGFRRLLLATYDAHGLYAQYGFKPIEKVESLMQIWQPDIYQSTQPEKD